MEATFVIESDELKQEVIAKLDELFALNDQPVTVTFRQNDKPRYDPQDMLRRMQALREKFEAHHISPDIDINEVIDSMYWEGNH